MELLEGAPRAYDWGSPTAIPELLGHPVDGSPVAELWFGAHASAPATVGASARSLAAVIAADPDAALGTEVAGRFGELPFLVKVLAAASPLSLQVHPTEAQAREGFAREEAAGLARDGAARTYRDPHHKPELICALTPFSALCGFRSPRATLELLDTIDAAALDPVRAALDDRSPAALASLLHWLLHLETTDAAALVADVVTACRVRSDAPHDDVRAMVADLGARHPADAGVITALLMNLLTLRPGDALFLGAGRLHMYLHGVAIEVMTSSDNVVRGGLTTKHVDVDALISTVDPTPSEPVVQCPTAIDGIARYTAPVAEFAVDRIDLDGSSPLGSGPAIVVCVDGCAEVGPHVLDRGVAAWIPASDPSYEAFGRATLYRVGVGDLP